jgi:hypothetical protein
MEKGLKDPYHVISLGTAGAVLGLGIYTQTSVEALHKELQKKTLENTELNKKITILEEKFAKWEVERPAVYQSVQNNTIMVKEVKKDLVEVKKECKKSLYNFNHLRDDYIEKNDDYEPPKMKKKKKEKYYSDSDESSESSDSDYDSKKKKKKRKEKEELKMKDRKKKHE